MADGTDRQADTDIEFPDAPLPEDSGLTLEEYLAMQQAIGHPTRYHILRTLVANEELSASELADALAVDSHMNFEAEAHDFSCGRQPTTADKPNDDGTLTHERL